MNWQLHHLSHKLQNELKLSKGSTFIANWHCHYFTDICEAIAINIYWVSAQRFTKCLFFFSLILKQIIKHAELFYLRFSIKMLALNKDIGGFHMNIGSSKFSFSIPSILWRNLQPHLAAKKAEQCTYIDRWVWHSVLLHSVFSNLSHALSKPLVTLYN